MERRSRARFAGAAALAILFAALLVPTLLPSGGSRPKGGGPPPPARPSAPVSPAKGTAATGPSSPSPPEERGPPVLVRVLDGRNRPLPGAEVAVLREPPRAVPRGMSWFGEFAPEPGPPAARGSADAKGEVLFDGLAAGQWRVRASAEGRAAAEWEFDLRPGGPPETVVLRLTTGYSLEGRVTSVAGKPVPGVRVVAGPARGEWSFTGSHRFAVTDGAGAFRLTGLAAGFHDLSVTLQGRVVIGGDSVEVPSVGRYDFVLPASCTLRCRVLSGDGEAPLPGAWVRVEVRGVGDGDAGASAQAPTGPDGTVVFSDLPPGSVSHWSASAEGFIAREAAFDQSAPSLIPEREAALDIVLDPGARIRGFVRDEEGRPIPGARVAFRPIREEDDPFAGMVDGQAGPDGRYELAGVLPGRGYLEASAEGFYSKPWPRQGSRFDPPEWDWIPEPLRVEVPPAATVERRIVLLRGGAVEGTAVDAQGRPVPGLSVSLHDGEKGGWLGLHGATTGESGEFRIAGIAPGGSCIVQISGPRGVTGASEPFRIEDASRPAVVRVVVLPGGTISGHLRVEGGPVPADARVSVAGGESPWGEDGAERAAVVAGDGTFRIEGVPPGKHSLVAEAEGFVPDHGDASTIEVAPGQAVEGAVVALIPERILRGRVVDGEDHPLPGAAVRVSWHMPKNFHITGSARPSEYSIRAVSGADGGFAVRGLYDHEYDLQVRLRGWFPGAAIARAGGAEAVLRLGRSGSVAGVVVAEDTGEPLAGVSVTASQRHDGIPRVQAGPTETLPDGSFRLGGLDGTRDCDLQFGRYGEPDAGTGDCVPREIPGVAVGTGDLRVALVRGLRVSGRVLDGEGKPIAGRIRVFLYMDNPHGGRISPVSRQGEAGADGSFEFRGLPGGNFWLTVLHRRDGPGRKAEGPEDLASEKRRVAAGTEGLEIRLVRGVPISGLVVDEEGGPVEQGWLHLGPPGSPLAEMEGSAARIFNGAFTTEPVVPGRTYDLVTQQCEGFLDQRASSVAAGTRDLVIVLRRAGRVSGSVLDPEGRPVGAGVPVRAFADGQAGYDAGKFEWVRTGAEGTFEFKELGPFRFRIYAGGTWPGAETPDLAPVPAEPVAPGTAGVEVRTRTGARVQGVLVDGSRRAGEVFYVVAAQPGLPGVVEYVQPGDDRSFTLGGLVPGRIVLAGQTRFGEEIPLGECEAPAEGLRLVVGGK